MFFPRWQNRGAGRAGGTQSLLLSSLAPSWGRRWKRACCFLPSCASRSSGPAPLPHAQLAGRRCLSLGSGVKAPGRGSAVPSSIIAEPPSWEGRSGSAGHSGSEGRQGCGIYRHRGRFLSPKQQTSGGRGSGITPECPSSSEGTRRKREQSTDAAGRASRSRARARDEIRNLHSGAASQTEEIPAGAAARWE